MPQHHANGEPPDGLGIFGLDTARETSGILLHPVPFDAHASGGRGCAEGPAAILHASYEIDLHDTQFGDIHTHGIHMSESPMEIRRLSDQAGRHADNIRQMRESGDEPEEFDVLCIDKAGSSIEGYTHDLAQETLESGRIPGIIGGDHSCPLGAIRACAEHCESLGILQFDAHMDLRDSYEGFTYSHASIMHNVIERLPQVERLVQVGLRDVARVEVEYAAGEPDRIRPHFDIDWKRDMLFGKSTFGALCLQAIETLPRNVYVSFDIDSLEPTLCPNTGTPVPGGLTFSQACLLLETLANSGRRIVGFDLSETAPAPGNLASIDGSVAARMLYKICGAVMRSQA